MLLLQNKAIYINILVVWKINGIFHKMKLSPLCQAISHYITLNVFLNLIFLSHIFPPQQKNVIGDRCVNCCLGAVLPETDCLPGSPHERCESSAGLAAGARDVSPLQQPPIQHRLQIGKSLDCEQEN